MPDSPWPMPTQPMVFMISAEEGVLFDPQGKFHGWLVRRHPDGMWITLKELEAIDPDLGLPPILAAMQGRD